MAGTNNQMAANFFHNYVSMKSSRMTQIFLTHISTFCSLFQVSPCPRLPALMYSRYSPHMPHCHMLHHSQLLLVFNV